jgi:hypothetical protein
MAGLLLALAPLLLGWGAHLPQSLSTLDDPRIDRERLLEHLSILAHDSMEGTTYRKPAE